MSGMQAAAVRYINLLPESKLSSAVDYLRYLCEQDYPLDDFDRELSNRADMDTSTETVTFDALMQDLGIEYAELQEN
ncbi:MAG: hypothetical protein FWB96_10010 [Defluviitaleaceae bacterium]|nr:hypothetical protein [Defluviitaleaceae bacterium]MCL2263205.1 hypothetical protein [Defluviitaleaceae bacterium]